jgi:HemY protein
MRTLITLLFMALAGVLAATFALRNDGNVVILAAPWRVDLSLNFFFLLVGVALVLAFLLARFAYAVTAFPERVSAYRQRRAEVGSHRALREALQALLEGRFVRAERAARAAQAVPDSAGLAALIGARAAHRLQENERRDAWLASVEGDSDLDMARLATSAELWAEAHQSDRALTALERLRAGGARHIHAQRIALGAYVQQGDWERVLRLARMLEKRGALNPTLAARTKSLAYRAQLQQLRHDSAALEAAWNRIPTEDQRDAELALEAGALLNFAGRGRLAAQALEAALEREWDERLLDEYARAQVAPARERIERVEQWLRERPRDPALLRCLGLICVREQLWGKARQYLAESLRERPHPATLLALARLEETLGNEAEALRHYREAALGYANWIGEQPRGTGIVPRSPVRDTTL